MANIDEPSKEEQTRIRRLKAVKHYIKQLRKWLGWLYWLYRLYELLEHPAIVFIKWIALICGSGPLDNYLIQGARSASTESLPNKPITSLQVEV
jgi:hypothetical protein